MYNRSWDLAVPHLLTFVIENHFVAEFDGESGAWDSTERQGM
jgi:hypothetical protein